MGYYIDENSKGERLNPHLKAQQLINDGAKRVNPEWQENLICVVENGLFDAAAYCYSEMEFDEFNDVMDSRRRTWITHPMAKELSGYAKSHSS